jgi:hypothetical protein
MRDDTSDWLRETPLEALQCRDLRHAWPRAQARPRVRTAPRTAAISWQAVGDGQLERTMLCEGGCGTRRIESFLRRRDGSLQRIGLPRYRHEKNYLRRRSEPDQPLERVDPDVLRGNLIARLYPALRW